MAKVDTNTVSLLYAKEATHGTAIAPTVSGAYTATEPNEIGGFGATITTTAREPISNRLQRQKGAVTDLTASAEFTADTTMSAMLAWLGPAVFAKWQGSRERDIDVTAVSTSAFTVATMRDASKEADADETGANFRAFPASALIWGRGFGSPANNGLRSVTAAAADDGVAVTSAAITSGGMTGRQAALVVDTSADGTVSLAGYRITGAGATTAWAWSSTSSQATLTATTAMVTAIKAGLKKGQFVHLGSVKNIAGDIQNAAGTNSGFARYTGEGNSGGTTLIFDRVSTDLQNNATIASGDFLDVIYGDFLKNVSTTDSNYTDDAFTLALLSTDLFQTPARDADNPNGVEYATGSKVGNLALSFALNDKATFSASFVSRDVRPPTAFRSFTEQKKEDDNDAYSTVADFARLRMDVAGDADGISTDFKSVTLTIDPQISPENVIGQLGARYVNRGNLLVTAEAEVIFASDLIPKTLRNNTTASFDMAISNDDGCLIFDVPALTIGGGGRSYPTNAAVTITGTGDAFEDSEHGASIMVSQFYVPIPTE